jgi:hypothetical protein
MTRNGKSFCELALGENASPSVDLLDVTETQEYGFEIHNRELDTEYLIRIGDIDASICGEGGRNAPRNRGTNVEWVDARYFESAYGVVIVRILSSTVDSGNWIDRGTLQVRVRSSKLTADRYEAMFDQLRLLAANIVFDLASKTMRSIAIEKAAPTFFIRTSLLELRVIEELWPKLASCIHLMDSQPARSIRREYVMRRCLGSEYLDARALATLARSGVNPRETGLPDFRTTIGILKESTDQPENRMVKGFLQFLFGRIRECQIVINQQIDSLKQHSKWRCQNSLGEPSLFEIEDKPKIDRLTRYYESSFLTSLQIQNALSLPFLTHVESRLEIVTTPVSRNVVAYRAFVHSMLQYLSTGILILDHAQEDRIKPTHRLYEQWVFLQVVSAIQQLGLKCIEQDGLLSKSRAFRFTLDFDRGARVVFNAGSRKYLSIRYEPWILPKEYALNSRETVFRSGNDQMAWSPDILIELIPNDEDAGPLPNCSYAIVIDAKYTAKISDHHWDSIGKYHQIRSTSTGRQIGRQLWIAYPGHPHEDDVFPITMRDSGVHWNHFGPDCPPDENVEGSILLRPARSISYSDETRAWVGQPEPAALELVDGLLTYLGIQHQKITPDGF